MSEKIFIIIYGIIEYSLLILFLMKVGDLFE